MKTKKPRVVYFCDIPMDGDNELDWEARRIELEEAGIDVGKPIITTVPPFRGEMAYDVLFFDWGGMMLGNSLMESFCREILSEAAESPSKMYVMASQFTSYAMKDFVAECGKPPVNVYLTMKDFVGACKDQGLLKKGKLIWL